MNKVQLKFNFPCNSKWGNNLKSSLFTHRCCYVHKFWKWTDEFWTVRAVTITARFRVCFPIIQQWSARRSGHLSKLSNNGVWMSTGIQYVCVSVRACVRVYRAYVLCTQVSGQSVTVKTISTIALLYSVIFCVFSVCTFSVSCKTFCILNNTLQYNTIVDWTIAPPCFPHSI